MFRSSSLAALVLACLAACATPGGDAQGDPRALAQQAINTAQARYERSQELEFAWRVTGQALAQARRAFAAEEFAAALKHARRAEELADLSLAQAQREAEAWRNRGPFPSSK